MEKDKRLREHLVYLLEGGGAHMDIRAVTANMPFELQGDKPEGAANTPWEVLNHMRIAQWDIVEFSRDPDHESPDWPDEYWPEEAAPSDEAAWEERVEDFLFDLDQIVQMIKDPDRDLYEPFPWGDGQTLLREALLLADHNSYHLGQIVLLRRQLGSWPPDK